MTQQVMGEPNSAEELLRLWKRRAQLWSHMAATWEPVIASLKAMPGGVPLGIIDAMRSQSQAFEKQMLEDGAFELPSYALNGDSRRTTSSIPDEELVREISRLLMKKNRRPQDLADLLSVPKERIERVLQSNTHEFVSLSGERGWWGLKR